MVTKYGEETAAEFFFEVWKCARLRPHRLLRCSARLQSWSLVGPITAFHYLSPRFCCHSEPNDEFWRGGEQGIRVQPAVVAPALSTVFCNQCGDTRFFEVFLDSGRGCLAS